MEAQQPNISVEQQDQLLFMMLIQQHEQIAMMGLGKLKNPTTDKIETDLSSAKYAIDTLMMLERLTKNNLSSDLKNYLADRLNFLRINYVDEKGKAGKKSENTDEEKK